MDAGDGADLAAALSAAGSEAVVKLQKEIDLENEMAKQEARELEAWTKQQEAEENASQEDIRVMRCLV